MYVHFLLTSDILVFIRLISSWITLRAGFDCL